MATVADILAVVDYLAPFRLAEEWDNIGLVLQSVLRHVAEVT